MVGSGLPFADTKRTGLDWTGLALLYEIECDIVIHFSFYSARVHLHRYSLGMAPPVSGRKVDGSP
jgi:hypothetical protein